MAKFETQIRMRCPVCGMVVWQNTLNAHHDFEMLTQQKIGRRSWRWKRKVDSLGQGARAFKVLLAHRLRQIAARLEREAQTEGYSSMSVARSATEMNVLRSPLTRNATRLGLTSSGVISAM